jgi:type I restriction enzyme, S subunit
VSELPLNWTRTSLGAICSKGQYGWTTKAAGQGSVKLLRTTDITKGAIDWPSVPYCQEVPPDIDKYLVRPNDILISRAGSVGFSTMIAYLPSPTVFASYLIRFVPCEHVAPKFVAYFLRSADYWHQISDAAAGIALANVNAAKLADVEIPLAPLNEQKRIADKVDVILARVDACRERLHRVPGILKRFRQTVLAAATSGKLTEEWRTKQGKFGEWPTVRLTDVGEIGRGKSKHRPRNDPHLYGGPYPFIQTGDVAQSGGRITAHTRTYSEFGIAQSKLWPAGTVCITIAANIADTAILEYPACFPDSVVGFVADPTKSLPEFIKWSIDVISKRLEAFAPATAQKNINLAVLNDVEFCCPALDEQDEIVRRVETLFAYADQLEARHTTARDQIDHLTPALLAKAFRGELVPQDPNDEPASVLLERIRSTRAAAEGAACPKRRNGNRVKTPRKPEVIMLTRKDVQDTPHLASILKERGPLTAEALWSASQLDINDFYDQLKDEEARGLLQEKRGDSSNAPRILEAA